MAESTPAPGTVARKPLRGTQIGMVVSDKRDRTRTVVVSYQVRHPKYGKYIKRQTRYHVHDQSNTSRTGDRVEIAMCRPISKTKTWRLVRVVQASAALNMSDLKTEVEAPK